MYSLFLPLFALSEEAALLSVIVITAAAVLVAPRVARIAQVLMARAKQRWYQ